MRVLLTPGDGAQFKDIEGGECFLHSGNAYLKFSRFITLSASQEDVDGSTKTNGGYNCVRLSDGRPGSFAANTVVTPKKMMVRSDT